LPELISDYRELHSSVLGKTAVGLPGQSLDPSHGTSTGETPSPG
jgi:hypothetical protein